MATDRLIVPQSEGRVIKLPRCKGKCGDAECAENAAAAEDQSERMTPYEGDAGDETDGMEHCL